VVGARNDNSQQGSAYIFDLDGTQLAKITASDGTVGDFFSESVAIGNGRIVVGATGDDDNGSNSGSAYIFDLDGTQLAKITASDGAAFNFFGRSVAICNGRIVVSARENDGSKGAVYIFDLDGTQLTKITASDGAANDYFGSSVAIGNGRIVIGAEGDNSSQGSVYIYETPNIKDYFDILE
jgi:Tol biopolymer transport system component